MSVCRVKVPCVAGASKVAKITSDLPPTCPQVLRAGTSDPSQPLELWAKGNVQAEMVDRRLCMSGDHRARMLRLQAASMREW